MNDIERKAMQLLADTLGVSVEYLDKYGDMPNMVSYTRTLPAIIAALTPPEGYVPATAILATATRLRRLASAASPLGRKAYIKAAEDIEMTVSATRPEKK